MLARIDRALAVVTALAAAFAVVVLLAGPELIGAKKETPPAAAGEPAGAPSGETVFADAGCEGCHTLAAAGATGSVGPNLDELQPSAEDVAAIVRSGAGAMPSFEGELSAEEIEAVAEYVASSAGP